MLFVLLCYPEAQSQTKYNTAQLRPQPAQLYYIGTISSQPPTYTNLYHPTCFLLPHFTILIY